MDSIKITILILIAFIAGAFAVNTYAQAVNLIEVPATINGYRTFDLLVYLAQLKAKDDEAKAIQDKSKPVIIPAPNSAGLHPAYQPSA